MAYETNNLTHGKTSNPWSLAYSAGARAGVKRQRLPQAALLVASAATGRLDSRAAHFWEFVD